MTEDTGQLFHAATQSGKTRENLTFKQDAQIRHCNQHAKSLPELMINQHVHLQDPIKKTWSSAKIVSKANTCRSYNVETEMGNQLRRN